MSVFVKDVERKSQQELGYKCRRYIADYYTNSATHDGQFLTIYNNLDDDLRVTLATSIQPLELVS